MCPHAGKDEVFKCIWFFGTVGGINNDKKKRGNS
jgi:hypothetical protein